MSLHKKAHKILYVTLNLGCSGDCNICLTKGLTTCSKLTVAEFIDWNKFRDAVNMSRAEDVILIGGESPFYNSSGHKNIYYRINDVVCPRRNLMAITSLKGIDENRSSIVLQYFSKVYVYIPEIEKQATSFIWLRGSTEIETVIRPGKVITNEVLNDIRKCIYPKSTVVVEREDRKRIPDLLFKNGDFEFISEDCIFNWQSPVYDLTTGEYRHHLVSGKSEKLNKPWREILGV